ncbi:MAG: WD40 repeat domain-containing protein [Desulfobacterales bacterium]|nr:WD40 repeat domain-containing protein [Desulfobacterales bacterium]
MEARIQNPDREPGMRKKWKEENKWIVSGSSDGGVRLWSPSEMSGHKPKRKDHGSPVTQMIFSPNGRFLVSGSEKDPATVIVRDVRGGLPMHEFPCSDHNIRSLAFNSGSRLLAAGDEGGRAWVWEMESGVLVNEFDTDRNTVMRLSFDPSGERLLAECLQDRMYLWDVRKGARLLNSKHDTFRGPAWQPGGHGRFLASFDVRNVLLRDKRNGKMVKRIEPTRGDFLSAAFSPDGRVLAIGASTGYIYLIDLKQGFKRRKLSGLDHPVEALAFNKEGSLLLACSGSAGFARIINVESHAISRDLESAGTHRAYEEYVRNAENKGRPRSIETFRKTDFWLCEAGFSPDGKLAGFQLTKNGSILYDVESLKVVDMYPAIPMHPSKPCCGNFHAGPSRSRWIMGMEKSGILEEGKNDLILYDRVAGREVARHPGPYKNVISSPADPAVFAAYKGRRVEIFSVQSS